MFSKFLAPRSTTRTDIAVAVTAVVIAIFKAFDTISTYKKEQDQ